MQITKNELNEMIQEVVESKLNEGKVTLKVDNYYEVLESGTNEWMDMEYLGYDSNTKKYIFRISNGSIDYIFMHINKRDLSDMVRDSL